jgi:pilus assembly protein CpaD
MMSMRLTHVFRAFAATALFGLAACGHMANGPADTFNPVTRFPVNVEPRMMTLRIPYRAGGQLDESTNDQLQRFADDYLQHGNGAIAISASRRFPDAPAAFAERLAAAGVPRNRILVGNEDNADTGNDVKLTYIRYVAQATPCGDWGRDLDFTLDNLVPANFGCTTQHNIAAMVADPRDLLAPQPMGPGDAQQALSVLDKYRKGQSTVAQKTSDQSGAVADVDK